MSRTGSIFSLFLFFIQDLNDISIALTSCREVFREMSLIPPHHPLEFSDMSGEEVVQFADKRMDGTSGELMEPPPQLQSGVSLTLFLHPTAYGAHKPSPGAHP